MKYTPATNDEGKKSKPKVDKRTTLKEAVAAHVKDGDSLVISLVSHPVATLHEIARQGQKDLTLLWDSNLFGSLLMGLGQVKKVEFAYMWGSSAGNDYVWRRAFEKQIPHRIEYEEYSNAAMAWRLFAGALGVPFMITRSLQGSDIPKFNSRIKLMEDPYGSGQTVAVVPAANPDVALVHCTKCDKYGNAQWMGTVGNSDVMVKSAKKVILTTEEIVPTEEIQRNPNCTVVPHYYVDAVVEVPFGSHWRESSYLYSQDFPFAVDFHTRAKTEDGFKQWCDEFIFGVDDWDGYCRKVGYERLYKLSRMERTFQVLGEIR